MITTLATDLDGTLIPVSSSKTQHRAIKRLSSLVKQHELRLLFVTGRSRELTFSAIKEFDLPLPDSILCDVGSTMLNRQSDESYEVDQGYARSLSERMGTWTHQRLQQDLCDTFESLTLQHASNQTPFKCSFDFPWRDHAKLKEGVTNWISAQNAPVSCTFSIDPETKNGLMDILPTGVNKGTAIMWWAAQRSIAVNTIVFAGDSGNDTAAITSGVRAILVGNADQQLRLETKAAMPDPELLFLAETAGPEGVHDGLSHHLGR